MGWIILEEKVTEYKSFLIFDDIIGKYWLDLFFAIPYGTKCPAPKEHALRGTL